MEDLSIVEIIQGLMDKSMLAHHVLLVQHLTNTITENDELDGRDVHRLSSVLLQKASSCPDSDANHYCALVANITTNSANTQKFLELIADSAQFRGDFIACTERFLAYDPHLEGSASLIDVPWEEKDPWQYFGNVLWNVCQQEEGRKILLSPSDKFLNRLVKQVSKEKEFLYHVASVETFQSILTKNYAA
jgi:hypothetical protein